MMKLFSNYKNWWSSLTSTFIGSLLGIGVTFGASDYIQNKQQKEMERKMMLTTVCDIDKRCKAIDEEIKKHASLGPLFLLMDLHYTEDWKGVFPKDKMKEYYGAVISEEIRRSIKYDEIINEVGEIKAFSNNSDLVTIFKDPSTIYDIKNILSTIEGFKMSLKILNNIRSEILDYDFKYKTNEMPDYEKHFIEYQFKYEGENRIDKMMDYDSFLQYIKADNKSLQTRWPLIKEKLGITDDDIRSAIPQFFDDSYVSPHDTITDTYFNRYDRVRESEIERFKSELKRIEVEKQSSSKEKTKSK